jgi:hypothetical protein
MLVSFFDIPPYFDWAGFDAIQSSWEWPFRIYMWRSYYGETQRLFVEQQGQPDEGL